MSKLSKQARRRVNSVLSSCIVESLEQRQMLTAIVSGQTIGGKISAIGQETSYTFKATAGQTFIANVGDATSTSTYQPDISVTGPDNMAAGQGYGYYDGTGNARNPYASSSAEVVVSSATAGTYTIVIQDTGGNESGGTYDLELAAAPATQAADANGDGGTITSGQTKAGTINHFGDLDVYTFTATTGQTVIANVGDATSASTYQPQISVYGPNGAAAGQGYGYYDGTGSARNPYASSSAEVVVSSATAGTYTIVIQDDSNESGGTYDLELAAAPATQAADADGNGGTITSGQTKAGTINHFGDLDVYTFTATTGQTVIANVGDATSASTYQPQISVYGPNGAAAGQGYGYYDGTGSARNPYASSSAEVVVSSATAGTYTIVIQDDSNESGGTYDLELAAAPATQAADADGNGGTITSGQTKAGTINHFGDLDVYIFGATAKDVFSLSLADSNSTTDYHPQISLYGPDGSPVGTGSGYYAGTGYALSPQTNTSVQINGTIPTTGTYVVVVQDDGGGEIGGTYNLELTGSIHNPAPSITITPPAAQTATTGVAKSFSLGSFVESNATGPYSVDVTWGDGSADTKFSLSKAGTITAQSHTYAKTAKDTVSIVITDSKGNKSNKATFPVTVTPPTNTASIAGNVFKDLNANGVLNTGETGLSGVKVYLDANKNGKLDSGETTVTTDSSGNYIFSGLVAGTYRVSEVVPSGYKVIAPAAGYVDETVTTGKALAGVNFADAPATGSISGTVFNDANDNQKFDSTELGLDGWQVYIDANKDGKYDAGDLLATTDINGDWSFTGLTAGTYSVRVVQVSKTASTTPTVLSIVLTAGQASTGKLFGEERIG